jgi:anti-sigma B factor antagonist
VRVQIVERSDGVSHVQLHGKLDVPGMHEIDLQFYAATSARNQPAIVDLTDLGYIASLGIGMLFACAQSLTRKGHKMVLVNPRGMVAATLSTARIDHVIPIVESVDSAVHLLRSV